MLGNRFSFEHIPTVTAAPLCHADHLSNLESPSADLEGMRIPVTLANRSNRVL